MFEILFGALIWLLVLITARRKSNSVFDTIIAEQEEMVALSESLDENAVVDEDLNFDKNIQSDENINSGEEMIYYSYDEFFYKLYLKRVLIVAGIFVFMLFTFFSLAKTNESEYFFFCINKIVCISVASFYGYLFSSFCIYMLLSFGTLVYAASRARIKLWIIKYIAFAILCIFLLIGITLPSLSLTTPGRCKVYDHNGYKIAVLSMEEFMNNKLYVFQVENCIEVRKLAVIDDAYVDDVECVWSVGIEIRRKPWFSSEYTEYISFE